MRSGCSFEIIKQVQETVWTWSDFAESASIPVVDSKQDCLHTPRQNFALITIMVTVMDTGPVDSGKLVPSAHLDKRYPQ